MEPIVPGHWAAYVQGALGVAEAEGLAREGFDVMIDADLPVGAGLASSAATLCAVLGAVSEAGGSPLPGGELARLARRAEVEMVGVPVGPMDHLASACSTAGHGLFIDCRDLHTEQIPLDSGSAGLVLLVSDTATRHRLVEGEYAARRESCLRAAAALGVAALRDTDLGQLEQTHLDPVDLERARHVITENDRVLAAIDLLRAGRLAELGSLLDESHASLAADFEVSTPELDRAVAAARQSGALGSRLTGAGFGGSTISLVPSGRVEAVEAGVAAAFAEEGLAAPQFLTVVPSDGARRLA
jgi:galactokinase